MEKVRMKSSRSCPKLFEIPGIHSGGLRAEIPGAHAVHVITEASTIEVRRWESDKMRQGGKEEEKRE
jgi:hypothetical protein